MFVFMFLIIDRSKVWG